MFKQILIDSTKVCEYKCVKPSDDDRLSAYEKACLGKCFDKYYGIYDKNLSSIVNALKQKQSSNEYSDKFWRKDSVHIWILFFLAISPKDGIGF